MKTLRYINCDWADGSGARREPVRASVAFTLIEIMVTIGLLSLIVLGLMAMFTQTQRAFRTGMKQTDVLESGRASMDMIARDMEQVVPSGYPYIKINNNWYAATNFYIEPSPGFNNPPLLQELSGNVDGSGNGIPRTNLMQRFFFMSKLNQDWLGTAYGVLAEDANYCVGTLYRFSGTNFSRQGPMTVSQVIKDAEAISQANALAGRPVTNVLNSSQNTWVDVNRVADGIVHLRVRAFAANGFLIVTNAEFGQFPGTNGMFALSPFGPYTNVWDTSLYPGTFDREQWAVYFMKEAVPAFVEVELGILEPDVLKRYRSIPIAAAQRQYLTNHAAEVHIFRQRIPIRNVDFTAYP